MEGLANWATRMSLYLQRRFALARCRRKAMKSRVNREIQARFREGLGVKSPGATRHDWVVYSKQPFGGPEHVLRYLGAYTHRVAISNSRLVDFSDGNVTFRWRDSTHGNKKRLRSE